MQEDVETVYGSVNVIIQGDRSKPAIMTYHDIGMNSYVTLIHFVAFCLKSNFDVVTTFESKNETFDCYNFQNLYTE